LFVSVVFKQLETPYVEKASVHPYVLLSPNISDTAVFHIFFKNDIENLSKIFRASFFFRDYQICDSYALLKDVKAFIPVLIIFLGRFREKFRVEGAVSFTKIDRVKGMPY
jgi:hypothetical protein